jgi:GntR family transcriptional regulator
MIDFFIDGRSGVPPYLQIVHQVKQAILLGRLRVGDQLPPVREVVSKIAINPNTVFKAYRDLEHLGVVEMRQGHGTFVRRAPRQVSSSELAAMRRSLLRWMKSAREAGLDPDSIRALFTETFQEAQRARAESA